MKYQGTSYIKLGIIFSVLVVVMISLENISAQAQPHKRGQVFNELPDIVSPGDIVNITGSNNISGLLHQKSDFSSKFGNSISEDSAIGALDKDLPAATDDALNPVIQCTNSNTRTPCMGTDNGEKMLGTDGDDFMYGLKGDDTMLGLSNVGGPAGYDLIDGGEGADKLYGGPDQDAMAGNSGNDEIYGEDGIDSIWGGEGDDNIEGGTGYDIIVGDEGSDTIKGGDGNDKIYHGKHTDSVIFDPGPDGSKDNIDCGDGQDEVWLNTGADGDIAVNCEKVHGPPPKSLDDTSILDDLQAKSNN